MAASAFSSLSLSAEFLSNLKSLDYLDMTPIQAKSLPAVLDGKDVQAQAKTGSGKTAAFGIGLLHNLDNQSYRVQALVLCPTRELADQVSKELRRLARPIPNTKILTLCGGIPIRPQKASLEHQPHIVVGTPGRILKHLQTEALHLDNVKTLVLDEADRMLDMGFHDDIMRIIDATPKQRQTLLFSATFPDDIKAISGAIQTDPIEIQVESLHDNSKIKQVFYQVEHNARAATLVALLQHYRPESSVVFCNRKLQCQELADDLWRQGIHVLALHGDLEQKERDQVLVQFANKSSSVLIATDVAARGLDIKDLAAVINFELSPDPEIHIHRIGRTGRAGNEGLALSLFASTETRKVDAIADYQGTPVRIEKISSLNPPDNFRLIPAMTTLCIYAGRKNKIRAGDILGALTANTDLPGKRIGKIDLFDKIAYVAVEHPIAKQALSILSDGKIKGRKYRVRRLR
ncbi:MAG TPA: ATP-dependent RNA helicase DbpA [Chromatiaceae bacterium]|jgi:ATP-independent RNA helicase DbpA|nr:ATP-dependent RNA helicase DbpA [Chromatiaceae bacterium]HIA08779.1 ATP-dependent RNA helicase DbpA [Chromatiaceae bacterium]HIB83476.1 ATP-dependent RNA helicase DbpA [Chromatiaceae bacterium]HIN82423.1 ATP-dependent RNA helicase DbpA [Chromatiales bacterium]HIO54184.1 ATP-dependent RNA helicase DbpA [Chromatiales bacterium]